MFTCANCSKETRKLHWLREKAGWCSACFYSTASEIGRSAAVIGDDIPGGLEIKHGICNEDGTPRKFYTKSAIREAAYQAGYFQGDDTPKVHPRIAEERAKQREARKRY